MEREKKSKKEYLSLLLAVLLTAGTAWATASNFGFNPFMTRYAQDMSDAPVLNQAWFDNIGMSFSAPLILNGSDYNQSSPVTIAAGGNYLRGYVCPSVTQLANNYVSRGGKSLFEENSPKWFSKLAGDSPTTSHPTLVTINGKKIVFIGSAYDSSAGGAVLQAFDITDSFNSGQATMVLNSPDPYASDIVSAPLVTQWNGHWIAVYSTGNTGRVCIMTGLDNVGQPDCEPYTYYLSLGGRTSSTPIGVMYQDGLPTGFAEGVDKGSNSGTLWVYRFNDILTEDGNGNVVLSSQNYFIKNPLNAGLVASFSASSDGNTIYFGDCNSRVYSIDVPTGELNWKNMDCTGMFSNRSPALSQNNVYFPAGTKPGSPGAVISIDRNTGETNWVCNLQYNVQTAPVIWPTTVSGFHPAIFVGNGAGYLAGINANNGHKYSYQKLTDSTGNSYATGITGEIALGSQYLLLTTNNNILAWSEYAPPDMSVELDPGCPKVGDKHVAVPGQTYTGTVTYNCIVPQEGNAPVLSTYPNTPIGAFHVNSSGTYPATMLDSSGNQVPAAPVTDINSDTTHQQVVNMQPNQQVTCEFKWTAQANTTELDAAINMFYQPNIQSNAMLVQNYQEANLNNNLFPVPISLVTPNLAITGLTQDPQTSGDNLYVDCYIQNDGTHGWTDAITTSLGWSVNGSLQTPIANVVVPAPNDVATSGAIMLVLGPINTANQSQVTIAADINPSKNAPTNEYTWADNTMQRTFTINNGLDLIAYNLQTSPTPAPPGATLTSTVSVGAAPSSPDNSFPLNTSVKLEKGDGTLLGTASVTFKGPGDTEQVKITWTAPSANGTIPLVGTVNPDKNVEEVNYTNNYITGTADIESNIGIPGCPDLNLYSSSIWPSNAPDNDKYRNCWYETEIRNSTDIYGNPIQIPVQVTKRSEWYPFVDNFTFRESMDATVQDITPVNPDKYGVDTGTDPITIPAGSGFSFTVNTSYNGVRVSDPENPGVSPSRGWIETAEDGSDPVKPSGQGVREVDVIVPLDDGTLKTIQMVPQHGPDSNGHYPANNTWTLPDIWLNPDGSVYWPSLNIFNNSQQDMTGTSGGNAIFTPFNTPNGTFSVAIEAKGAGTWPGQSEIDPRAPLAKCFNATVNIQGNVYQSFVIRTIEPTNPFPAGVGSNWVGHEDLIQATIPWNLPSLFTVNVGPTDRSSLQ